MFINGHHVLDIFSDEQKQLWYLTDGSHRLSSPRVSHKHQNHRDPHLNFPLVPHTQYIPNWTHSPGSLIKAQNWVSTSNILQNSFFTATMIFQKGKFDYFNTPVPTLLKILQGLLVGLSIIPKPFNIPYKTLCLKRALLNSWV